MANAFVASCLTPLVFTIISTTSCPITVERVCRELGIDLIAARFEETFIAARLFEGSCKADDFNDWLIEQLCPRLTEKYIVILDNAQLHKTPKTRQLIEASGASLMFLPPYSPDYHPIEHDFANIKRMQQYQTEMSIDDIIQMYQ